MTNGKIDSPTLDDGIEVTPEMIAAGVEGLEHHVFGGDIIMAWADDYVAEVFASMLRAAPERLLFSCKESECRS
jgi:hypothetical protein